MKIPTLKDQFKRVCIFWNKFLEIHFTIIQLNAVSQGISLVCKHHMYLDDMQNFHRDRVYYKIGGSRNIWNVGNCP